MKVLLLLLCLVGGAAGYAFYVQVDNHFQAIDKRLKELSKPRDWELPILGAHKYEWQEDYPEIGVKKGDEGVALHFAVDRHRFPSLFTIDWVLSAPGWTVQSALTPEIMANPEGPILGGVPCLALDGNSYGNGDNEEAFREHGGNCVYWLDPKPGKNVLVLLLHKLPDPRAVSVQAILDNPQKAIVAKGYVPFDMD